MSRKDKEYEPSVKDRKQATLKRIENNRHLKQMSRIDEMSEKRGISKKILAITAGGLAVFTLANGVSERYAGGTGNSTTVVPAVEDQENATTSITADPGDGYEMLVRREAERSGLSDDEIQALPIQNLVDDAKQLNNGQMVHPNRTYVVPDIQDVPKD